MPKQVVAQWHKDIEQWLQQNKLGGKSINAGKSKGTQLISNQLAASRCFFAYWNCRSRFAADLDGRLWRSLLFRFTQAIALLFSQELSFVVHVVLFGDFQLTCLHVFLEESDISRLLRKTALFSRSVARNKPLSLYLCKGKSSSYSAR